MANYSGFSQTSNISGISSISRSTSIRSPLKADLSMKSGLLNTTACISKASFHPGKRSSSQSEEVNKAFLQCEEIINDFAIKKLILECVEEASLNEDETLPQTTAKKLRQLITNHEIEKYLHLPNNSDDIHEKMTLLGITDLPKVELNYEEKLDIKRLVEKKLRKKTSSFLARFEKMGGNMEELMKRNDSTGRQHLSVFQPDLFEWKEKIEEECLEYERKILEYGKYFSEWINLKYGDMNDIQLRRAESLLTRVQVSEAQARITKLNCITKMFKDTPFTLEAYQTINSNLDSQLYEMEEEIRRKKGMIKLYDDLRGTEYDQVVQRYSELCKAIEKKKRLIEDLS